jgi:hypothetical protein
MTDLTTVDFHGAKLVAVKGNTPAETLVAMKPVVEGMGLDWEEQRRKLHRHPVLAPDLTFATVQMPGDDQRREWAFLPLTRVNFWLATVQPGRIHDDAVKAKVIDYQRECADVLFAHFFAKAGGDVPASIDARTVGGVVKGIVNKRIEPLEQTVSDLRSEIAALSKGVATLALSADGKVAALERITVRKLMDEAGAVSKGRNSLNRRVRNALMKLAAIGNVQGVTDCPHTGVALFPIDFAREFMRTTGNGWVRQHNAVQTGQGVIKFPARRRKPVSQPSA